MRLFRRTPRMKVGRFEPPPEQEPASLARLIEEGMLIAEAGVRLTLRNAVILGALRDRADFDRGALREIAVARVIEIAESENEAAERDAHETGDYARRRVQVRRGLARELELLAADEPRIDAIVERSRAEAWEEVAVPLAERAERVREAELGYVEPIDPTDRAERVAAFVAMDLAALADERGVALEG